MGIGGLGAGTRTYVVLGDVVDSREIDDRATFRDRFERTQRVVATDFDSAFAAGPSVLKGIDELGGVMTSLTPVYDVVITLQRRLHPHAIRIAVARGEIDFGAADGDVSRMDGEAFHRATELLEAVDRDGLWFGLDTGTDPLDTAVADEINLLLARRAEWTDRQRDVVAAYERLGTQTAVAEELGVSQQSVSNVLQGATWPLVETIETRLRRTLTHYDEDTHDDSVEGDE